MISVWFLICLWFSLSWSHQYYDETSCSSDKSYPGTRYSCNSSRNSCETFFVFRANNQFPTISTISNLFNTDSDILISVNQNVSTSIQVLDPGHEVLIPITCSCTNHSFSQANFTYKVTQNTTLSEISCGIFEGLVKTITLAEDNLLPGIDVVVNAGFALRVPLKCACPDEDNEVKYLVTYPFVKGDNTEKVSEKFNVSVEEIWEFNQLDPTGPTVYPNTTILVPLKNKPSLNFNIPDSDPPTPTFLPTIPVQNRPKMSRFKKLVICFSVAVAFLTACVLYIRALKKFKTEKLNPSTNRISSLNYCSTSRTSTNSCLSPDLLVGIKYSLYKYTLEDLKRATKNFSEDGKIGDGFYKGLIENDEVMMITKKGFEETQKVINVHSRINHVNIVKLSGVCYSEDDFLLSYLVFEFPSNGSLRDCLASSSSALHWFKRTQVAFDIAMGLHYLNYSVIPAAYNHLSISCKNVFLTSTWRAKIAVFGTEKVDIFAFGVVLIELISGKEVVDGDVLRETKFLVGGNEGGCFDKLRKFVDPCLRHDYPIAEALCLVVLAGSCVDDDPLHRPSMDDVLKILARMV